MKNLLNLKKSLNKTAPTATKNANKMNKLMIDSLYSTFLPTFLLICSNNLELVT